MKNLTIASLSLGLLLVACGDNDKGPVDAPKAIDAPADATVFPAAPTLGAVIDRMGRPAVNTALNAVVDTGTAKTAKKDAYNHAALDPITWGATVLDAAGTDPAYPITTALQVLGPRKTVAGEFRKYLGIFDTLDQGSTLPHTAIGGANNDVGGTGGCGNGALYGGFAGTSTHYATLATVLSDDELYVDTAKLTCNTYLSVEVDVIAGAHSQCGGRTPSHDVIDSSYSLLASGANGFAGASFTPLVGDGVTVHADVSDSVFPFLGTPH
jgi:hypothetical protein